MAAGGDIQLDSSARSQLATAPRCRSAAASSVRRWPCWRWPRRTVTTDALIEALWRSKPRPAADGDPGYVSQLRKVLGTETIATEASATAHFRRTRSTESSSSAGSPLRPRWRRPSAQRSSPPRSRSGVACVGQFTYETWRSRRSRASTSSGLRRSKPAHATSSAARGRARRRAGVARPRAPAARAPARQLMLALYRAAGRPSARCLRRRTYSARGQLGSTRRRAAGAARSILNQDPSSRHPQPPSRRPCGSRCR